MDEHLGSADVGRDRRGDAAQRGSVPALGLDLARMQDDGRMGTVVEHLLGIQRLRGESSSLLFVRGQDLDRLAGEDGRPLEEFLSELQQLGFVVSSN